MKRTGWAGALLLAGTLGAAAGGLLDYDGDGLDDVGVFYSDHGAWYILQSQSGLLRAFNWGFPESQPVLGDFDGDGMADPAVYVAANGRWHVFASATQSVLQYTLGGPQDAPVPADYDGDNKTDVAVYNRITGVWRIRESDTGTIRTVNFGWAEAKPVPKDYDGDGKADIAVYHPAAGNWYIFGSDTGFRLQNWGYPGARAVPEDYDGDGMADIAVYDRKTGVWHILGSLAGPRTVNWGFGKARPVVADYDGDGKADVAVYERAIGRWYIWQSATQTPHIFTFGWDQATPLPSYGHGGIEGLIILCFGDSITYGTSSSSNGPATGYPALLKRLLGPALGGHFDTVNAGVPGETTGSGEQRIGSVLNNVRPELLLLMQGTNDHVFKRQFAWIDWNLRSMIQQARAAGSQAMLATIPPVITNEYRDRTDQAARIRAFNPTIYNICSSLGIPVVRVYEAITSQSQWQSKLMDQPTANHPNDAGYRVMTQEYLRAIRQAQRDGYLD